MDWSNVKHVRVDFVKYGIERINDLVHTQFDTNITGEISKEDSSIFKIGRRHF